MKNIILIIIFILQLENAFGEHFKFDWKTDGAIDGAGIILGSTLLYLQKQDKPLTIEEISSLNRNDVNRFDRSATNYYSPELSDISDYLVDISAALPLAFVLDPELKDEKNTYILMFLQNIMLSGIASSGVKESVSRYRPFVYNPGIASDSKLSSDNKRSFFSGHTTLAFASSVFFSSVYEELYPNSKYTEIVWAGSLMVASSVGYLRYRSGKHYPTDILTGAVVGSLIGYLVPYCHKSQNLSINYNSSQFEQSISFSVKF